MKKQLLILLAALLLFCGGFGTSAQAETMPSPPEEPVYEPMPEEQRPPEERLPGDWYAAYQGLVLTLSLAEDGSYAFRVPGCEDLTGTWALVDGLVVPDGKNGEALLPVGNILRQPSSGLLFTRDMPEIYIPGEIDDSIQPGDPDGYWKSRFVAVGDGTVLSSALGETTDIYIEGTRAALGGPLFGDVIVDMAWKDGTLTCEKDGVGVTLALQRDGFLRLTAGGKDTVTLYLLPATPGWAETESIEAPAG